MIIKQPNILKELRNIILASGYSDIELAEKSGLSKEGIYKIRSGKTESIRSGNATKLLEVLNYELSSSADGLKIKNILTPLELRGEELSAHATEAMMLSNINIINDLREDKDRLLNAIESEREEIIRLKSIIKSKDKLISKTNIHIPALEPSRYQAIVRVKPLDDTHIVNKDIENNKDTNDRFLSATYMYAEFLGYKDQFDIIDKHYIDVVHPDEYDRIKTFTVEDLNDYVYLKVITKTKEAKWVKSNSRTIQFNNGLILVTDIMPIDEDEYLENVFGNYDTGITGQG